MIRTKRSHALQHNKSVNGLKRAGLNGIVITGDGDKVYATWIGNLEKALATTHMAFNGNPLLKQLAEMISGPKIEVSKGEPVLSPLSVTDDPPGEETSNFDGVNSSGDDGVNYDENTPEE